MSREPTRRMTDKIQQVLSSADHDLLIRIAEKLESIATQCASLSQQLGGKATLEDVIRWRGDHEARIRLLEQSKWVSIGALIVLQVVIGVVIKMWK